MGATTELLRLLVEADTKGAVQNVERVGTATTRELGKSEKSMDRWGSRLTSLGTGMVAFGAVALGGLAMAARASEEAELSVVKLENTISNMPALAGENSQQFIDLAESIQQVTAADADAIVAAEAMLGTFSLTADEITGITPLVVDYARKFGVDMVDAATQVGKALDGQVGALKRNGVSIDEVLFRTDRYRAVQEALADQVGGFAEQEGATFAGSLERLKNQLGDIVEGVGSGAVDAFSDLAGMVQPVVDRFNDLSPGTQNAIGRVATFGSVALIAAGGTSVLIGQILKARENFKAAASGISDFAGSLTNTDTRVGKLGRALVVGSAALTGWIAAGQIADEVFNRGQPANVNELERSLLELGRTGQITGSLQENWHDLSNAIGDVFSPTNVERVGNLANEVIHLGGAAGSTHLDRMKEELDSVDKALAQLARRDPQEAAAALDVFLDRMAQTPEQADAIRGALDDYDSALAEIDTSNAVSGTEDLGGAMDTSAEDIEAANTALEDYESTLRGMTDPLFGLQDAVMDMEDAQGRLNAAEMEAVAAQQAYNDAVAEHGPTSDEAREAALALMDAQGQVEEATLGAGRASLDLAVAQETLRSKVESGEISIGEARRTIIDMALAAGLSRDQALRLAGGLDTARAAGKRFEDKYTAQVDTSGYPETSVRLAALKSMADSIPRSITITVGMAGVSEAVRQRELLAGYRQHGGPVEAGRLYEVAEQGKAELLEMGGRSYLIPGTDGRVIPADAMGGRAGGVGGPSIVIDMRGAIIADDRQFEDMVIRALRNAGGSGKPITIGNGRRL